MFEWAAQWLRRPAPDEEAARLRAQLGQLRNRLKASERETAQAAAGASNEAAEGRRLRQVVESLEAQLQAAHDTIRDQTMRLRVADEERGLLEQVILRQQNREERDAKIAIVTAESALRQVERLSGGMGYESAR